MRLLLDELWAPTIAAELRKRRFDVIAINEQAQASRYAGTADDHVFARVLSSSEAAHEPSNRVHYLRVAPVD